MTTTKQISITAFYAQHKGDLMSKAMGFSISPALLDPYYIPNIRDTMDDEHIAYFKGRYLRGEEVEPIVVLKQPLGTGNLAVLEGRHRTHGATQALKENPQLRVAIRVVDIPGVFERFSYMLKTDRRKEFSYLERANAVASMKACDESLTNADLAEEQGVSKTAIENYLLCAAADDQTKDLIREGHITGTQVTEYVRKYGAAEACAAIMADLNQVERKGTAAPRGKKGISKFSHAKCLTVMEILLNLGYKPADLAKDKGVVKLELGVSDAKDLISIIDEYQDHCGLEERPYDMDPEE